MDNYDSICCFRSSSSNKRRLLWELTLSCNLYCDFCHRGMGNGGIWTLESAKSILPEIQKLGISEIILSGGEPLLIDWLEYLIIELKYSGFDVDLCTNATLVTRERAAFLAELLSEVSVSLDSATPAVHDSIRGLPGAWSKAINGCQYLIEAGLDVHIISIVDKETIGDMLDVAHLCQELGAGSLSFIGKMPMTPAPNPLASQDVQNMIWANLSACREKFRDFPINTKRLVAPQLFPRCEAGGTILGLDAKGYLLPCILLNDYKYRRTPTRRAYGEFDISLSSYTLKKCTGCSQIGECGFGCPGSYFLQMGDVGPDTLCAKIWSANEHNGT